MTHIPSSAGPAPPDVVLVRARRTVEEAEAAIVAHRPLMMGATRRAFGVRRGSWLLAEADAERERHYALVRAADLARADLEAVENQRRQ